MEIESQSLDRVHAAALTRKSLSVGVKVAIAVSVCVLLAAAAVLAAYATGHLSFGSSTASDADSAHASELNGSNINSGAQGGIMSSSSTGTASPTVISLSNGVASAALTVAIKTYTYYSIVVPAGQTNLTIATSGTGDDDVYIKRGSLPTAQDGGFDWKAATPASAEFAAISNPVAGTYYILVDAWSALTNIRITATYSLARASSSTGGSKSSTGAAVSSTGASGTGTSAPTVIALANGVASAALTVPITTYTYYSIVVPAGQSNLTIATSGGTGDDDVYIKRGSLPTAQVGGFDWKAATPASAEFAAISNPVAGTYYILVDAWSALAGVRITATYSVVRAPSSTGGSKSSTGGSVASSTGASGTGTGSTVIALQNGVASAALNVAITTYTYYSIVVPAGQTSITIATSGGTGDDDVYIKRGSLPTAQNGGFDWKAATPAIAESATIADPVAGTYYILVDAWTALANIRITATYTAVSTTVAPTTTAAPTTAPPTQSCATLTVTPAIATQAAWDAKYDAVYSDTAIPNPLNGGGDFSWHGHYWLRSYLSMAATFGDVKYMNRAKRLIDYWFAHSDTVQGWLGPPLASGLGYDLPNGMLNTGVIAHAVALFTYQVWKDSRWVSFRTTADAYLTTLEPMLHTYDKQWVTVSPGIYNGNPSFWQYYSCPETGGLCGERSLIMYNQGATMATALLLIDRTHRLAGRTPDAAYVVKAGLAAAYFKTFVKLNAGGDAYLWNYEGTVVPQCCPPELEDTSHGHLDVAHLSWALKFGLGGITRADMLLLTGTLRVILTGQGANDAATVIDGTGNAGGNNWKRVATGFDWIDLTDYDSSLFDKIVQTYNTWMSNPEGSRFYLGWAEILRKKNCVPR